MNVGQSELSITSCVCGWVQNVFMVHALKRISYATCNPSLCQFSFLARNRRAPPGIQCCHVFFTSTPQEVYSSVHCIIVPRTLFQHEFHFRNMYKGYSKSIFWQLECLDWTQNHFCLILYDIMSKVYAFYWYVDFEKFLSLIYRVAIGIECSSYCVYYLHCVFTFFYEASWELC